MKRALLFGVPLALLVALGGGVAIVRHNLWLVSREFAAADAFLRSARARARALERGGPAPYACSEVLTAHQRGQAFFGVRQFVALLASPAGEALPWSAEPTQLIVGSDACSFAPEHLESIREWNTFGRRARDFVRSPAIAREGLSLNDCMSSSLTSFGVVLIPHLEAQPGAWAGPIDVEVFEFPAGKHLCRGTEQVTLKRDPSSPARERDALLTAQVSQLIDQLLAVPPADGRGAAQRPRGQGEAAGDPSGS
jgi:hypothetical protein